MHYSLKAGLLLAGILSPLASQALTASRADLAAFLGTTKEAIEAINPRLGNEDVDVTRGSALRRTLNVNAGDTLTFDWLFGTDEGTSGECPPLGGPASTNITRPLGRARCLRSRRWASLLRTAGS